MLDKKKYAYDRTSESITDFLQNAFKNIEVLEEGVVKIDKLIYYISPFKIENLSDCGFFELELADEYYTEK